MLLEDNIFIADVFYYKGSHAECDCSVSSYNKETKTITLFINVLYVWAFVFKGYQYCCSFVFCIEHVINLGREAQMDSV